MGRGAARNSRSGRRGGPLFVLMLLIAVLVGSLIWQHYSEGEAGDGGAGWVFSPGEIRDRFGESYTIEQKVSPGGRLGWHTSEQDPWTQGPRVTRQANHYYFVCRERSTGEVVVFEVPRERFNLERVGNRIRGRDAASFHRVEDIQVPELPSGYGFDRGER